MSLPQRFREHVLREHLFTARDKLLLAVSGGVDSVVLCELCRQSGYEFAIAHCNFNLRGKESERDRAFAEKLAEKYQVTFWVRDFDTETYATENKLSVQEAARSLRYGWFRELVASQSPGPVYLLTAHHADDNNETLLMNFFRGTGLHGLTGIPARNDYVRRPLLPFSKEELVAFARENHLEWVEDSSNDSVKYTRNYFRHELIPAIEKVFPQVKENLQDNISRFREIESLYQVAVNAVKARLVRRKGQELYIPVKQLLEYHNRALVYELIARFGFTEKQVDEVIRLAGSESGHYMDAPPGAYRIIKHRHWFIISPIRSTEAEMVVIEQGMREIIFPLGKLHIGETANHQSKAPGQEMLDIRSIRFPLLLRKWKTGDYFYPLGMKKKKKIARFLIDLKLSKSDKEKVWVLESGKRILWVVGYRIDDRFRITGRTKQTLSLRLEAS